MEQLEQIMGDKLAIFQKVISDIRGTKSRIVPSILDNLQLNNYLANMDEFWGMANSKISEVDQKLSFISEATYTVLPRYANYIKSGLVAVGGVMSLFIVIGVVIYIWFVTSESQLPPGKSCVIINVTFFEIFRLQNRKSTKL